MKINISFYYFFIVIFIIVSCKNKNNQLKKETSYNFHKETTEIINYKFPQAEFEYKFKRRFPFILKQINRVDDFENIKRFQINCCSNDNNFVTINGATNKFEGFDLNFEKQFSIGETGEGPEEFLQPHFVFKKDDKLLIHDFRQHAIKEMSLIDNGVQQFPYNTPTKSDHCLS